MGRRFPPDLKERARTTILMDAGQHMFFVNGKHVYLPPKEWNIAEFLLASKGNCYSREKILVHFYPSTAEGDIDSRTVDQHIARIRMKLGEAGVLNHHTFIETISGYGYRCVIGEFSKRNPTMCPKEIGEFVLARLPQQSVEALSSVPEEARSQFYGRLQDELVEVVSDAVRELTATD